MKALAGHKKPCYQQPPHNLNQAALKNVEFFLTTICPFFLPFKRATREEMSAAAASGNVSKSESMKSGLVGNIYGQDVEAAKQGGKS